jgi:hypothetical protein
MTINIGASNPMATPPVLSNKYIKAGTYNVHIEGMSYWMDDGEGGEALCHHVNNNSWVDQAILGDL